MGAWHVLGSFRWKTPMPIKIPRFRGEGGVEVPILFLWAQGFFWILFIVVQLLGQTLFSRALLCLDRISFSVSFTFKGFSRIPPLVEHFYCTIWQLNIGGTNLGWSFLILDGPNWADFGAGNATRRRPVKESASHWVRTRHFRGREGEMETGKKDQKGDHWLWEPVGPLAGVGWAFGRCYLPYRQQLPLICLLQTPESRFSLTQADQMNRMPSARHCKDRDDRKHCL